jgi:hypothetical protein
VCIRIRIKWRSHKNATITHTCTHSLQDHPPLDFQLPPTKGTRVSFSFLLVLMVQRLCSVSMGTRYSLDLTVESPRGQLRSASSLGNLIWLSRNARSIFCEEPRLPHRPTPPYTAQARGRPTPAELLGAMLNSLPYIDNEISDPATATQVQQLVQAGMRGCMCELVLV